MQDLQPVTRSGGLIAESGISSLAPFFPTPSFGVMGDTPILAPPLLTPSSSGLAPKLKATIVTKDNKLIFNLDEVEPSFFNLLN